MSLKWVKKWNTNWKNSFVSHGSVVPKLFGLQAWYDFTSSQYLTLATSAITQALDRSGNGNNTGVQGTGTARPTFTSNQLNGLPLATFDGGDFLALPSRLFTVPTGSNTIFAVAKRNSEAGTFNYMIGYFESGISVRAVLKFSSTSGSIAFDNNNNSGNAISTGNTNTNYQIISAFRSGTTQSIQVNNGTATSNTNATNVTPINNGFIGSSEGAFFLTGGIAEMIIYNRALTTAEIVQVNRYLSNKYAITIS